METLKYTKIREVKSPVRGTSVAAGIDFFVPTSIDKKTFESKCKTTGCDVFCEYDENENLVKIILHPGESVMIPSGIKMKVPRGHALVFMNKSGIGAKKQLDVLACVTGNTIIETNKVKFSAATLTPEFCKLNNILVKTFDFKSNTFSFNACDGFRITQTTRCIKVTFDDGTYIEGDENHHIWINNKWIALKDL